MKINEKHLVMFARGSAAVDKQGYLNKRGELNKSFQRRWFMLKGNLLFYFDKKEDTEPIGVIVLEGCSVELAENADKFSFELTFLGSGARTYVLAADSQEEMEDWMQLLACAGYEYMKCAVEELQRQLDELNSISNRVCRRPSRSSTKSGGQSSASSSQVQRRANPFNSRESAEADFPLLIPTVSSHSRDTKHVRTFEEMHQDFGAYIAQMAVESRKSKKKPS